MPDTKAGAEELRTTSYCPSVLLLADGDSSYNLLKHSLPLFYLRGAIYIYLCHISLSHIFVLYISLLFVFSPSRVVPVASLLPTFPGVENERDDNLE